MRDDHVKTVYDQCMDYFHTRPYNVWFNPMKKIISDGAGVTYDDGSCCHLDIVQWATQPVWRYLSKEKQDKLLEPDLIFLKELINYSSLQVILLNGRTSYNKFLECFNDEIRIGKEPIEIYNGGKLKMYKGAIVTDGKEIQFVGWNLYRQSAIKKEIIDELIATLKSNL